MHLEATAVLLGLQDLGGKLLPEAMLASSWSPKFGHFVGDVEAKSGYGRSR